MARKAKAQPIVEDVVVELVEEIEAQEVVEQSTGSSLVSQLVQQVVEAEPVAPKAKVEKNEGVGLFIRNLIAEGLSNKDILAIVHEQYGNTNTSYACVAWYRNKMKKDGKVVAKTASLDWLQNFAKAHNLDENAVTELARKVA